MTSLTASEYLPFIAEWLDHPEWWFAATPAIDAYLTRSYEHLLDADVPPLATDRLTDGTALAAVVAYDQLPHHVYRGQAAAHIIAYFLRKALAVRARLAGPPSDTRRYIFYQLPVRHSRDPVAIHAVMADAWSRPEAQRPLPAAFATASADVALFKKFLKATYERCPRDAAPFVRHYASFPPSPVPPAVAARGPIPDAIAAAPIPCDGPLIVSLSGGVDSMVLFTVLATGPHRRRLHAVHINYANRPTTAAEESFVVNYAARYGIPLTVRRFTEIRRADAIRLEMRETYETYTRDQRFATYRHVASLYGASAPDAAPDASAPDAAAVVFLGHNADDTTENILTNIVQKKKYDALTGMLHAERQPAVAAGGPITFLRPMLGIAKTAIYDYAAANDIPHLPDSTVPWCQRGQIRDTVLPTLLRWDRRVVDSLQALAEHVRDLSALAEREVARCSARTTPDRGGAGRRLLAFPPDEPPPSKSPLFWRMYFQKTFGIVVSFRALTAFTERIAGLAAALAGPPPPTSLPLRKNLMATITPPRRATSHAWHFEFVKN